MSDDDRELTAQELAEVRAWLTRDLRPGDAGYALRSWTVQGVLDAKEGAMTGSDVHIHVRARHLVVTALAVAIAVCVALFVVMQVRANNDAAHEKHCNEEEMYAALSGDELAKECR